MQENSFELKGLYKKTKTAPEQTLISCISAAARFLIYSISDKSESNIKNVLKPRIDYFSVCFYNLLIKQTLFTL